MQTLTISTKLTKKYLMAVMRQRLKNRTFNREQFTIEYGLHDRKVRRYLNQIASEFQTVKPDDLVILQQFCIDNLTEKAMARELDESTEVKIALAGETHKLEVKGEYTETKNVNINVKAMLAEYEHLLTETRNQETTIPADSSAQQVHTSEANPKASNIPIT